MCQTCQRKYHIFQVTSVLPREVALQKKTFVALNILPTPISFFISSPLRFKIPRTPVVAGSDWSVVQQIQRNWVFAELLPYSGMYIFQIFLLEVWCMHMYDFDPWKLVYLYLYMSCELPRVFFPVNVFATMIRTGEDHETTRWYWHGGHLALRLVEFIKPNTKTFIVYLCHDSVFPDAKTGFTQCFLIVKPLAVYKNMCWSSTMNILIPFNSWYVESPDFSHSTPLAFQTSTYGL